MPKISVVICCFNAQSTIGPALKSVQWADEIVVVDSGSTDETPAIARQLAHQFVHEPWRGFTEQKKFGVSLARNDWVFVLDHDEECSERLAGEVAAIPDAWLERYDLFLMPRHNHVMGRLVRAWNPDYQNRIFHRHRCTWADEAVNDARHASDPSRVRKLTGWLEHKRHGAATFKDYFHGALEDDRLMLVARQMHARGRRCRWWDLVFRPLFAFIKFYFIKRGFLDGAFGLMIAQKGAHACQLRYAALWAVQNGVKEL